MSNPDDNVQRDNPRRTPAKKTWKNKNDNTMNSGNNKPSFNINNKRSFANNRNNNRNDENGSSFTSSLVPIAPNNNNNANSFSQRGRPFIRPKARQYRSGRNTQNNQNNANHQQQGDKTKELEPPNNNNRNRFNRHNVHRHNAKHKAFKHHNKKQQNINKEQQTQKKQIKAPNKSIVIDKEQLIHLNAGDHVEITTKHNQIIDGIVYCSIPQVPPLCIIHHYNPQKTKNVHVVALHEISRCIKFDEPRQERTVSLRPINDENANEILEKNLAERKAKMETLNISVTDTVQELFDFLYRTSPNKCQWNGNSVMFPDMKITVNAPYKKLTLNGCSKKNKSIQYVDTQLANFWKKHAAKQQKLQNALRDAPRVSNNSNNNSSEQSPTNKKKKKKKNKNKQKQQQNQAQNKDTPQQKQPQNIQNNQNNQTVQNGVDLNVKNIQQQQQTQQLLQHLQATNTVNPTLQQFNIGNMNNMANMAQFGLNVNNNINMNVPNVGNNLMLNNLMRMPPQQSLLNDPNGILMMNPTQLIVPQNVFQQQQPQNIFNAKNNNNQQQPPPPPQQEKDNNNNQQSLPPRHANMRNNRDRARGRGNARNRGRGQRRGGYRGGGRGHDHRRGRGRDNNSNRGGRNMQNER